MQSPQVMRVVAKYHAPGSTLQQFYGLGPLNRPQQTIRGRTGVYDIFNGTRSLAPIRSPISGPSRIAKKPVGTQTVTLMRSYTAIDIMYEQVYNSRPIGGQWGTVDEMGQAYIARQMAYGIQHHRNNHEFMAAHMFRGGWGLLPGQGEDMILVDKGTAGSITVDTLVPSDQQGKLAVGGGPAVIDVDWDNAAADIRAQLMKLQFYAARVNGRSLKHVWVNGNTGRYLFDNTGLQAQGGSAYRIFDTLNPSKEIGEGQKHPDTGISVVFRALPEYIFHIYNQGYVPSLTGESTSAQTGASWVPFIPDNYAIITPEPSPEWCGLIAGSEPFQPSLRDNVRVAVGFDTGRNREIDPPREELKFLNNSAAVLFEEKAVYYAKVIGAV
jgi:hypothetical protein